MLFHEEDRATHAGIFDALIIEGKRPLRMGWRTGLVDNESGYVALPKDSPFRETLAASIPGKTSGPPADLVGTLLLLCSAAGEWITGQTIQVDGGWIPRL